MAERPRPVCGHLNPHSVPVKEAGDAFPPCVTEMETEAQSEEGIIVFGISGPTHTQFPPLGLNLGIKIAKLK